jgi:catechol 2,3-dioxygenase-like lactoylglutathione lyase family enzyme
MAVKRIVANIAAKNVEDARAFYSDVLGLDLVMDH